MSKDFEAALHAAEKGGMTGLTLWKTTTGWQANLQRNREGWTVAVDADPLVALNKCMGAPFALATHLAEQAMSRMTAALDNLNPQQEMDL